MHDIHDFSVFPLARLRTLLPAHVILRPLLAVHESHKRAPAAPAPEHLPRPCCPTARRSAHVRPRPCHESARDAHICQSQPARAQRPKWPQLEHERPRACGRQRHYGRDAEAAARPRCRRDGHGCITPAAAVRWSAGWRWHGSAGPGPATTDRTGRGARGNGARQPGTGAGGERRG